MVYLKDNVTLTAYASDASIYAVIPRAVRQILQTKDIQDSVQFATQEGLSITPRGAGTGLAGGAVGSGLILDFGQFNDIVETDEGHATVLTQVGIIYDELNLALEKYGLFFPPDPSSGDSCQIGGMIANNSSGPRSVKYGLTSNFVEELEIVSSAGKIIRLKKHKLGSSELEKFLSENQEYGQVLGVLERNSQLIKARWPKLKKNSAGYNLLQVINDLDRGVFNLPALMVGSEGTLAVFSSARLRLQPIPQNHLTARLYFESLVDAGKAVAPLLGTEPSGLEIVDGSTLDLIGRPKFGIPPQAAALLLIEFDIDVKAKREHIHQLYGKLNLTAPIEWAHDAEATTELWKARKAIVPTLYRHHPTKRPLALVEDISLPGDEIPGFIGYAASLFGKYNLTFGMFGHIGDGNLHIRPLFDLNDKSDFELARRIYDEIYEKVISLGGSTTAEHADGRLRASLVRKIYGDEIFSVFTEIKRLLDPNDLFSPHSMLSEIVFTEKIDYEKIKSYCAACGKCNGYCPAYDIFRREDYSPRGWLRIINQSGSSRRKLGKYLKYCLNCKNCAVVCPAGVDIASEIINFHTIKPSAVSKIAAAFADNDLLLDLALKTGRAAQSVFSSGIGRSAVRIFGKPLFGIDKNTQFPSIAEKRLQERFADRLTQSGEVALFHGCADNLLKSNVGEAVFTIFDRLGLGVGIPEQKCCGLPYEVHGHRNNLIEKAKYNIDNLGGFEAVITGCASCLLRLKEYKKLFDDNDPYKHKAEKLAGKCFDISQYLNLRDVDFSIFGSYAPTRITYHHPCHLRAAGLHKEPEKLLAKLPNVEIIHPKYADRCCAQAGSYGFVHYRDARRMFKKKKDEYSQIKADYLMTSCPACQMKIRDEMGGRFRVVHPIEILAERLKKN